MLKAIDADFGSFEQFKAQMEKAAVGLFGSGWAWLAEDKSGKLAIVTEQNAGNPMCHGMKPLMCFDVWEHAYYIDYRNRRADAVAALWDRIDWRSSQTVTKRNKGLFLLEMPPPVFGAAFSFVLQANLPGTAFRSCRGGIYRAGLVAIRRACFRSIT